MADDGYLWRTETVVVDSPWDGHADWAWPVRIGVLTRDGSLTSWERIRRHRWNGELFHLLRARASRQHFDLLLVDGSHDLALEATCTATAVVVFSDAPEEPALELRQLAATREAVAAPVAVLQPRPEEPARWLYRLVKELSHSHRLEAVLSRIWQSEAPGAPLIVGDRQTLASLDLENATRRILAQAQRLVVRGAGGQELPVSRRLQADLSLGATANLEEIASRLEGSLGRLIYDGESHGATTLGQVAAAVTRAERSASLGPRRDSWLGADQGRRSMGGTLAYLAPGDGTAAEALRVLRARLLRGELEVQRRGPLEADTPYAIQVSIGPPATDWLGLSAPFVEPDAPPDDPRRGWRLRVVAWEPTWLPEAVEETLWLPAAGPSEAVTFSFSTGPEAATLGARVTVLHENRVLQSGLLVCRPDDPELRWSLDAAPEPQLGALDPNRWFDASFVINDDVHGKPRATCISDHEVGLVDLDVAELDQFTSTVGSFLNRIAADPELYEDLESDDTVALLRSLAQKGWNLYETLVCDTRLDADRLAKAGRIQIVSAKATAYFPAELLYCLEPPEPAAKLCPGARAALLSKDGKCHQQHSRAHVCPTGFWSLSKIVERHAFLKSDLDLEAPFVLYDAAAADFRAAPSLDPLGRLLFAASQKVDGFDPKATADLQQRAGAVCRGLTPIDSLAAWELAVRDQKPSLFVFLPHHFRRDLTEKFELGPSLEIQPSQLRQGLVRRDGAPRPLVLLVGCDTADTRIAFDSFVQKFRRYGASAVISTFATILGRHAAPATSELLETLDRRLGAGPVRLGDVLFDIRRHLLADGKPMALGLTAYGDADLTLARE